MLILDNDGVLTDGSIIYDDNRLESKAFSVKDGLGIKLLKYTDIEVAIITGRKSDLLLQRCEDLNIKHIYQDVRNKLSVTENLMKKLNINWNNVAYIGDDWNDYPVMNRAILSACPGDAFNSIKKKVHYVCNREGGKGAVREFINLILKKKMVYDKIIDKYLKSIQNNE